MKRIFALALVLCMAFALCTLTACKDDTKVENIYADFEKFDSYVPEGSEIIGTWKMTAPTDDMEWQFFANTSLHMTKIQGDVRTSTVCTYNYDGEGNLELSFSTMMLSVHILLSLRAKSLSLQIPRALFTLSRKLNN